LKKLFFLFLFSHSAISDAQDIKKVFNDAYKNFVLDSSFKHSSISLLVINNSTGKKITDVNSEMGLAPASCQKVITASTAFELLGHDYTYKTTLGYTGQIINGVLNGDIIIKGSGDPTLGSWRYNKTKEETIISEFTDAISRLGINEITGHVYADESLWTSEVTPDGWIWQDIGNYYGAGARALNWRENQYDLHLRSGDNIGDHVEIVRTNPAFLESFNLTSLATSGKKGSGDNAYVYLPLNNSYGYVRGTIPVNESDFIISGAIPHPAQQLAITLEAALKKTPEEQIAINYPAQKKVDSVHIFYTYTSPPLDSIVYWFLKRSINLYGEVLLKTIAYESTKTGDTDSGVNVIQSFWNKKNIEPSAMHIIDGSGLSPGNRITTATLVRVMEYAKKQSWFPYFYDALPEINGIKMKSGSISGAVSYTGFIRSKKGVDYTFAFIINNFEGSTNETRKKMWKLLDVLK
jgi:D-alanyl-D-alanine carboxypeptidase/D-alanyl-D-alanine-endopeptidase (penicillin-binding protein 4)